MKKLGTACLLLSATLLLGCPGEESADTEACEHLQEGPDTDVTATANAAGAPAVKDDHRRYDVTLVDVTGGKGGSVSFASSKAAHYVLFLNTDVPLAVATSGGQGVSFDQTAKSSTACSDVKGRYAVPLGVGTYTLTFGPATATSVSLVVEAEASESGGHQH